MHKLLSSALLFLAFNSCINWKPGNLLHQEQILKFIWCKHTSINFQICLWMMLSKNRACFTCIFRLYYSVLKFSNFSQQSLLQDFHSQMIMNIFLIRLEVRMHDWIKILFFTFYLTYYLWHFTNPMTAETRSCLNCSLSCFFWLAHSHLFLPSLVAVFIKVQRNAHELSCSVQLYCIYLAYHSNLKSFLNPFFPFKFPFLYKTL